MCLLGMFVLIVWVNALTAVLTFVSMVGYGIIYTVFLKPATPQNIVIGGAAGAAPPLLGWVAMANAVTPEACLLFLIIFACRLHMEKNLPACKFYSIPTF